MRKGWGVGAPSEEAMMRRWLTPWDWGGGCYWGGLDGGGERTYGHLVEFGDKPGVVPTLGLVGGEVHTCPVVEALEWWSMG